MGRVAHHPTLTFWEIKMDLRYGIEKIWKKDFKLQTELLSQIILQCRNVKNNDLALITLDDMHNAGMFFVPYDEYMIEYFGEAITRYNVGLFSNNYCVLTGRLAMPITFFNREVIGFIGYSAPDGEDPRTFIKYLYPSKLVFSKGNYMYIERDEYIKAIKDGYICIVDGLFDKRRLESVGVNAVSLCGSALTPWHRYYLSFIKHKIVVGDNDEAGRKLFHTCHKYLSNCIEIKQGLEWDVDDFLKTPKNIERFLELISQMKTENFLLSHTLHEEVKIHEKVE